MRYGLFYLPSSLPSSRADGAARLRTVVEQTCYGEQLGFDSVWLAEHHFHSFGGLFSATPVIGAAIAQQTTRIRIGTAVILLPYHNPLRVAEDYATLDCLSEGRLEFGIGHGFVKWEALTFGIPLDELRERFRESLEVILKAWSEPMLNHKRQLSRISRRRSLAASNARTVSKSMDGRDVDRGILRACRTAWLSFDAHSFPASGGRAACQGGSIPECAAGRRARPINDARARRVSRIRG
jgi:alkanesulfonate monooxygenase SsuD/methylene tetrahydromethanopterin reductase-like flavin-dependent oxidoreductase (luciferase family)